MKTIFLLGMMTVLGSSQQTTADSFHEPKERGTISSYGHDPFLTGLPKWLSLLMEQPTPLLSLGKQFVHSDITLFEEYYRTITRDFHILIANPPIDLPKVHSP